MSPHVHVICTSPLIIIMKCVCYPLSSERTRLATQIKQLQLYRATSARVGARPNLALKASARRRALQCAMMSHAVGWSFKYLISSSLHGQNASSPVSVARTAGACWCLHTKAYDRSRTLLRKQDCTCLGARAFCCAQASVQKAGLARDAHPHF